MPTSSYPLGFASGLTVRGVPLVQSHPGKAFWVSNAANISGNPPLVVGGLTGNDGNPGSFLKPFATLKQAFSSVGAVAGRGDIVYIKPGHAETISSATALTLATQGVAVIGLGYGSLRPTFTLDTATTSTVNVTAGQILLSNLKFVANFAAVVSAFTLTNAPDFTLDQVDISDTSSILNFVAGVTTDATSTHAAGLTLDKVNFYGLGTTASTTLVSMLGTNDRVQISNSYLQNKSTTDGGAVMIIATGKIVTNFKMVDNIFNTTGTSAGTAGTLITTNGSTNTGVIARNFVQNLDATTEILVTASSGFTFFNNYSSAVADKSGYLLPAADS